MDRSKIVAIVTGVISLLLAVAYLVLVQVLDFRGEMQPAPVGELPSTQVTQVASTSGLTSASPIDLAQ